MAQIFKFTIDVFDEIKAEMVTEYGVVAGTSMADATGNICKFYGEENIESILIEGCEDTLSGIVTCDANSFENIL